MDRAGPGSERERGREKERERERERERDRKEEERGAVQNDIGGVAKDRKFAGMNVIR